MFGNIFKRFCEILGSEYTKFVGFEYALRMNYLGLYFLIDV